MKKVGITGGIGSGKSTICKIFELLGVPVFNSDTEAKGLMNSDLVLKNSIVNLFGNNILSSTGAIDRKALAAVVFNDKQKLKALNELVHPAVGKYFESWLLKYKHLPYIIKEAAILFESGANKQVDKVIVVTAPKELRINRTLMRGGAERIEIEQRINNQLPEEELKKLADYVISNDETKSVIEQVITIHKNLLT